MRRPSTRWSGGVGAVVVGHLLLLMAWSAATPPFQAPDEVAHYRRAASLARGVVLGEPVLGTGPGPTDPVELRKHEWQLQTTRVVLLPPPLSAEGLGCALDPSRSAACVDVPAPAAGPPVEVATNTGTTTPLAVAAPAVLVRLGGTAGSADSWARVGQVVLSAALLLLAAAALAPAGGRAGAGLALAVTPMALYLGAVVNPSGVEVLLSLACLATAWRMLRPDAGGRWVVAAAVTAGALPLVRQPGAVWAVLALALAAALRPDAGAWRRAGRRIGVCVAAVLVGTGLMASWGATTGVDTPLGTADAGSAALHAVRQVPLLLRHAVGEVNVYEFRLPTTLTVLWAGSAAGLAGLGMVQGGRRRWAPLLAVCGALLTTVAFWVLTYRFTGFALQGRHVLPAIVLIPVAGALALPAKPRLWAAVTGGAGLLNLIAWYLTARRFAAGTSSPLWFWPQASWDPWGGWVPWTLLAAAGAAALVLAAVQQLRRPGPGASTAGQPISGADSSSSMSFVSGRKR